MRIPKPPRPAMPSIAPPEPPLDPPLPGEDDVMRSMRMWGVKGPITREMYLGAIHATDDPIEPSAEMESLLPLHLQDWSQFEKD